MRGKVNLCKACWNPKTKVGVTMLFFRDNKATIIQKGLKYKTMYGIFSQIEGKLSPKKCVVTPSFLFGFQ